MSRLAPTRAASAAQPRGAAALNFDFTCRANDLRSSCEDCAFICARTLARLELVMMWPRRHISGNGPGGPVLWFYDALQRRTNKSLENRGSMVLFYRASRDTRMGAGAHAYRDNPQNHRTIELDREKASNSGVYRFYHRFYGSTGIKYGVDTASAVSGQPIGPDQGVKAGGGRRDFSGRRGAGGGDRRAEAGRAELRGSDGFPPFFEGLAGLVGMAMLECSPKSEACQCVARAYRKPAGLASIVLAAPRGVGIDRTPGTPPSAARRPLRGWPQPVFRISIDVLNRSMADQAEAGRSWSRGNGSGLGFFPCLGLGGPRSGAKSERGDRIGDRGASCRPAKRRAEAATLWGGCARVN